MLKAGIEVLGRDAIVIDLGDYPAKSNRAMVRALNRAIKSGQSVMTKAIAGDTGLKQKDVRDAMSLREATSSRPEASLGLKLERGKQPARMPVMDFRAKQTKNGVTYRLPGSKGRLENAFIATMKSGHEGVFERTPGKFMTFQKPTWKKKRQAIHEKFGPSIGQVFTKFRPAGLARALEVFQKNFDHELEFVKGGAGAGTD